MKILGTEIKNCCLVTASTLDAGLENAVDLFLGYMEKATGVRLTRRTDAESPVGTPIVVGETALDTVTVINARQSLGQEGYVILADEGRLFLSANTVRGTIYALYGFLEDCVGWRFLASGCQVLHKADEVNIPEDIFVTSVPGFESRDLLWYDSMKDANQTNALRLNGTFMRHMDDHGGGITYGGGFVHTISALAECSGEVGYQPCLTDENVFQTVRKNVRRLLEQNPDLDIISVSQNDSYADQPGCQCASCRAIDEREGTPMGSLLTFVNRLADDIREDYPRVAIDTLAYRYTRKAPKTIKPADNVIIRLCSIECCFSHPISDRACAQNAAFCQDIEAWAAICDRLYIWDYTTNFLYYLSPFPNLDVLWDNVQFFKNHHVRGLFEQGNYQSISGEFAELRSYLLAHLLWKPDMTRDAYYTMMDEFLADYYGPGWKHIRRYIDWTSANAATVHMQIYGSPADTVPSLDENGVNTPGVYGAMVALFDAALAEAETDEQRAHIERSRLSAEYLRLVGAPEGCRETDNKALWDGIRSCGLTHLHEGGPSPAEVDLTANPLKW